MHLLRVVLSCDDKEGCAALLDALRRDALARLAFPSMDVDDVELGRHRRIFDLVCSGGDLSDILLERCDLLVLQNEKECIAVAQAREQLGFQRGKIAERDGKLKDLNKNLKDLRGKIAARDMALKTAKAAVKRRRKEIKTIKTSLTYRVGAILTWPLRKAWDVICGQ